MKKIKLNVETPKQVLSILTIALILILTIGCGDTTKNDTIIIAQNTDREIYTPTTISDEAKQVLNTVKSRKSYTREGRAADDIDGWKKEYDAIEEALSKTVDQIIEANNVLVSDLELGGIPVLNIQPENWVDNGKVLVYTHGGAYTMLSARSTLGSSAPMSKATGLRLISVDYTPAPSAHWNEIQDQVITVIIALLDEGYEMSDMAIFGDSAGGGLTVSTVLNLRDAGLGMPAAVLLLSPWVDMSNEGDSQNTLKNDDPTLRYDPLLKNSARAYAGNLDIKDPRVSPYYADFTKGFPPSMITEGTKCILLSSSVRFYQKLEAAGQEVKLDLYEGMWHVFQQYPMPESEVAIRKSATFINKHLNKS